MAWPRAGPGRPVKEKSFATALNVAIREATKDGRTKLRAVADMLVTKAMEGDMAAIKELADRVDGRPAQENTLNINDQRDATDWTRDALVALLRDAADGGPRVIEAHGLRGEPDSVHRGNVQQISHRSTSQDDSSAA